MKRCRWCPILCLGLVFLLASLVVGCGPAPSLAPPAQPPPTEPVKEKPAEFEVGSLAITPSGVMVGDSATVTTTVKNIGDITGTYTAILAIDGQEIDRKDVSIEPHNISALSFQVPGTAAGSYELTIGDSSAIMTVYDWSPCTIQYDTGIFNALEDVGIYITGDWAHIVHFTPPAKPFKIQKVKICGDAEVTYTPDLDQKQFTVRIWSKDGSELLWAQDFPWRLFKFSYNWVGISVPDIRVDDDFNVEVVTHSEPLHKGDPYSSHKLFYKYIALAYDFPQTSPERLAALHAESHGIEMRSGVSYMGKLVEGGYLAKDKVWFIRVEGEGKHCD